ncbi:MAG: hypothetical protein M1830_003764 [Pleopsidium flavum]|nr:MAG: hypothetical protein M1830_003764 [Pleopsidium flavum]
MVSSAANRAAFITSALQFVRTYAFDGIDIDWEYPVTPDRGGTQADFTNYVTFMRELRATFGNLGVTATIPSSYWYLRGFDIKDLQTQVDWFNFMSYDIHGIWDGTNPYTSKTVAPHTNLTEIDQGLSLLWRNGISPSKVVMGLGFYGRSFSLSDPSCNVPGCRFSGGGDPGNCTRTSGILSNSEIQRIITQYTIKPILDSTAAVKYMSWNADQWVSYDDADTFKLKLDYANSLCLAGTSMHTSSKILDVTDIRVCSGMGHRPRYKQWTIGSIPAIRRDYGELQRLHC